MTRLDWILAGVILLAALGGWRRGLVATVLSLAALAAGAVYGARLAPHFLSSHTTSHYSALVGLAGAVGGALVLQAAAALVGSITRTGLRFLPPLRLLDSLGGLVAGALAGAIVVWVAGAVILQVPGLAHWKREVRTSQLIRRLDKIAPPRDVLKLKVY